MANVKKLRSFLEYTGGGRSGGSERSTPAPPRAREAQVDANDIVGENGASVNDIMNLVDYVAPPAEGLPDWVANATLWDQAMRTVGVNTVAGDDDSYEAVALTYHALGGSLMTSEDRNEEVERGDEPEFYEPVLAALAEDGGDEDEDEEEVEFEVEEELGEEEEELGDDELGDDGSDPDFSDDGDEIEEESGEDE